MKNSLVLGLLAALPSMCCAQWEITSGPIEPNVVTMASNDNLLVVGCASTSTTTGGHLTLDQGNSWSVTGLGLGSKFTSIELDPETEAIYAGGSDGFYQSYDAGESYINTNNGLPSNSVKDIFVDQDILYASCNGLYTSSNGGFNWDLLSPQFSSTRLDKFGNIIVVGSQNAGLYLSLNNGETWSNYQNNLPVNLIDVKIANFNIVVATAFGAYYSTDGGFNWNLSNLEFPVNCLYRVNSLLFAGVTDGGVYYSSDNGITWMPQNSGLTNLTVFSLTSDSDYLFAGTTGYVFRRSLSDFEALTSTFLSKGQLVEIYPNPSKGQVTAVHEVLGRVLIEICDVFGRVVFSSRISEASAQLDLSSLRKGTYIINLRGTHGNTQKRIILF